MDSLSDLREASLLFYGMSICLCVHLNVSICIYVCVEGPSTPDGVLEILL